MPPHDPSASWCARIQFTALAVARRRSQPIGRLEYRRRAVSSHPKAVGQSRPGRRLGGAEPVRNSVDAERHRMHRPRRLHQRQRHDGLPGPAAPVVDVERCPGRQQDQLRRHHRHLVPGPEPEQRQPDPGEHPAGLDAAAAQHELGGSAHVLGGRVITGQPQRDPGLRGGGQVGRPAVERRPAAVGPLLAANPARRLLGLGRLPDAEELPQQQILGIHRDVGFQLALPPAGRILLVEQPLHAALQCLGGRIIRSSQSI